MFVSNSPHRWEALWGQAPWAALLSSLWGWTCTQLCMWRALSKCLLNESMTAQLRPALCLQIYKVNQQLFS